MRARAVRGLLGAAALDSALGQSPHDVAVVRGLAGAMTVGDHLLLGVDQVKALDRLHAAYNDAAGVTAEFNRNVLRVLNRELQADFDVTRFDHVAFYDAAAAQIEMHLRARDAHSVRIAGLDRTIAFTAGETIHTESSRTFTRATTAAMLAAAGFRLQRWYTPPTAAFALALATVEAAT